MQVIRGYKYELRVNNKEKTLLTQCAGTARFTWNWGLIQRIEQYKAHKGNDRFTDAMKQHKTLNHLKKTTFGWMYNYSKCIPQEALRDLDQAFKNFLRGRKKGQQIGFPKLKKKNRCKDSFRLTGVIKVNPDKKQVQLPRLGRLRLNEKPNFQNKYRILSATVSRTAYRWFVSFTVEESRPSPTSPSNDVLGFDAGLVRFGFLSTGLPIVTSKFLLKRLRKLRRLSKSHSRKQLGSKNRRKSARKLARFHKRITDSRNDFLHKTSTSLTKNHGVVVVEDLYVKGLMMNKKQSKYWQDLAHGDFQQMLSYKTKWYGSLLIHVPRFFPSSKLCSNCLWYNKNMTLTNRIFTCPLCGLVLDRDFNAALNLENYYHWYHPVFSTHSSGVVSSVTASSPETLTACGEFVIPSTPGFDSGNQE